MTLASRERALLCDLFDLVGPDRPTLCGQWSTRDLLAHLLVRERQPWTAPGILVPALAPITERAMRGYAGTPWGDLVGQLRGGAPVWSPYWIGAVDAFANGAEFFVHHEDVRRGEPGWEPRSPDPARDDALWSLLLRMGRLLHRRSPVGVVLRRLPGPGTEGGTAGREHQVRSGPDPVTIVGEPGELVLHAFGRDAVRVTLEGDPTAVAALAGAARGL